MRHHCRRRPLARPPCSSARQPRPLQSTTRRQHTHPLLLQRKYLLPHQRQHQRTLLHRQRCSLLRRLLHLWLRRCSRQRLCPRRRRRYHLCTPRRTALQCRRLHRLPCSARHRTCLPTSRHAVSQRQVLRPPTTACTMHNPCHRLLRLPLMRCCRWACQRLRLLPCQRHTQLACTVGRTTTSSSHCRRRRRRSQPRLRCRRLPPLLTLRIPAYRRLSKCPARCPVASPRPALATLWTSRRRCHPRPWRTRQGLVLAQACRRTAVELRVLARLPGTAARSPVAPSVVACLATASTWSTSRRRRRRGRRLIRRCRLLALSGTCTTTLQAMLRRCRHRRRCSHHSPAPGPTLATCTTSLPHTTARLWHNIGVLLCRHRHRLRMALTPAARARRASSCRPTCGTVNKRWCDNSSNTNHNSSCITRHRRPSTIRRTRSSRTSTCRRTTRRRRRRLIPTCRCRRPRPANARTRTMTGRPQVAPCRITATSTATCCTTRRHTTAQPWTTSARAKAPSSGTSVNPFKPLGFQSRCTTRSWCCTRDLCFGYAAKACCQCLLQSWWEGGNTAVGVVR